MRIAYIATGAAGMYCGTCLQDNTLATALLAQGHDVVLIPTYTPTRTDGVNVSLDKIFYGAINVYLQEKLPFFRRTPRFLDALLDRPWLLNALTKRAISSDARDLGALTLSVLQGEDGHQKKELDRLVGWLRDFRPDVVHLNQAMFAGMARTLRRELRAPVVCALSGEDLFLEDLPEPYRARARDEIRRGAADVDAFTVTSEYYRDFMSEYLQLPRERFHVVRLGIPTDGFAPADESERAGEPFTVGYLARICPEKGLHVLIEGFRELAQAAGSQPVRLRVAGYLSKKDEAYFAEQKRRVEAWGLADRVELVGEVDREAKLRFLHGLDVLCVPTVYKEPKGLFVLEALASGVPVVLPRHGAFPELIELTGGGLLVEPQSPSAVAAGLRQMMEDGAARREMGRRGREAVLAGFHDGAMAESVLRLYEAAVRAGVKGKSQPGQAA
jgi:glycosyltransferase involved in cell wall biosynthesis